MSTSMKTALANSKHVFRIGYCSLQYLFKPSTRTFYNSGIYGWNCDIFHCYVPNIGLCVLTTGYRNMKGTRIPDSIARQYNNAAKIIWEDNTTSYNEKENIIYEMQEELFRNLVELNII